MYFVVLNQCVVIDVRHEGLSEFIFSIAGNPVQDHFVSAGLSLPGATTVWCMLKSKNIGRCHIHSLAATNRVTRS
jgi:hypothetical protein